MSATWHRVPRGSRHLASLLSTPFLTLQGLLLSAFSSLPSPPPLQVIERLRAQHVFPMAMLRLAEHEWDAIVSDAAEKDGRAPHSFDADQ